MALSRATERRLRLPSDADFWRGFEHEVHDRLRALPDGATAVDLGGGRRCVYHHALRPEIDLVAVDIDAAELALNEHASRTVVADVSQDIPLASGSVDLLVSRAVLEHVPDVRSAAASMARVLKPGAHTMHLLPARYSVFGMAARILPFKPLLWLLHKISPTTVDQVEFDVHYDQGWPEAMQRAFREAGFTNVRVDVTWAQGYFEPVYPLFVLGALYERIARALNARRLAAYLVVSAERA